MWRHETRAPAQICLRLPEGLAAQTDGMSLLLLNYEETLSKYDLLQFQSSQEKMGSMPGGVTQCMLEALPVSLPKASRERFPMDTAHSDSKTVFRCSTLRVPYPFCRQDRSLSGIQM